MSDTPKNINEVKFPNIAFDIEDSISKGHIKVVSDQEAAECEWRVCSEPPGVLARNVNGKCSVCDRAVVYDPTMPTSDKQKLICIPCVMSQVKGEQVITE